MDKTSKLVLCVGEVREKSFSQKLSQFFRCKIRSSTSNGLLQEYPYDACIFETALLDLRVCPELNYDRLNFILAIFFDDSFKGNYPLVFVRTCDWNLAQIWKDSGGSIAFRFELSEDDVIRLIQEAP